MYCIHWHGAVACDESCRHDGCVQQSQIDDEILTSIGAKYDEFLTKNTSVLVCNTKKPSAEKFKFASENGIPIVHAGWLWECLEARVLKPFGVHVLKAAHPQPQKPIRQPQQPYTDVPTAPISEEDSANLRRRKAQAAKPASKPQPRKIKQRPGELALSLATNPTLASTTSPRNPFSTDDGPSEDEEGIPANDGPASPQPLQDINPSVNSSRRPSNSSTSTNAKSKAACTSTSESNATNPPPKPAPVPRKTEPTEENQAGPAAIDPPVEKKEDPAIIMSRILAQRKTAAEYQNLEKEETRKKKRQLGRATSNPSTASGTELDSRAGSAVPAEPSPDDLSLSERERERDDDPKNVNVAEVYKPSQELGWDDPGAQAARERMIRAMGGRVEETGVVVVEPTGVMKDIVSEGGRGRRRRL